MGVMFWNLVGFHAIQRGKHSNPVTDQSRISHGSVTDQAISELPRTSVSKRVLVQN